VLWLIKAVSELKATKDDVRGVVLTLAVDFQGKLRYRGPQTRGHARHKHLRGRTFQNWGTGAHRGGGMHLIAWARKNPLQKAGERIESNATVFEPWGAVYESSQFSPEGGEWV